MHDNGKEETRWRRRRLCRYMSGVMAIKEGGGGAILCVRRRREKVFLFLPLTVARQAKEEEEEEEESYEVASFVFSSFSLFSGGREGGERWKFSAPRLL